MTQGRRTVVDAFLDSASRTPHRVAFRVIEKSNEEFTLSYADVHRITAEIVTGLTARSIEAGHRVVIALPASRDFLAVYLGCLCAGVAPVVVAEPKLGRTVHYGTHLRALAERMNARLVIASAELEDELSALLSIPVVAPRSLRRADVSLDRPRAALTDLAHLQATSGSTGTPKLAVVRHGNIVANVEAIAEAIRGRPEDVLVSWLPPSHDMGLIGLAYALYWQIPMVLAETSTFLQNPLSWLQWLSRHRGTLSPAPNSAFQMCARIAKLRPPRDLDLSAWRVALCGAEPVHESTMRQFQAAFGPSGLSETTLVPVYGLAEATLAVTIADTGRPFSVDRIDAEAVAARGRAEPKAHADARALAMVCVGRVVPGHRIRVVDAGGAQLPDRAIGEIEVSGPSVVDGYLNAPESGDELKRSDGFLRTGDLGYLVDGELYITGRRKDVLIISGRNYTPNQIETFVETLTGSPLTPAVVAVGLPDPKLLTEQLHLLLDVRIAAGGDQRKVAACVSEALAEVFGLGGVTFHWVTSGQIPRTSSGKVQRYLCRKLAEEARRANSPTGESAI
jgi:fatty-acyl-CoA synthase